MPVNIIIGAPGSGKTEDIYKDFIDSSSKFPNKKHIVITPEQNTLLTEKRLLAMNPKHILFNIDVLSFNRAAHLIFEKAGIGNPEIIDETGKSMLLRRIIGKNSNAIKYYSSKINMPGFINKLKVMISELLMYGVSPDDIAKYLSKEEIKGNDSLKEKLEDLKNVLELFSKAKDEHHLTTEELIPKSLFYIDNSKIFDDTYVVFDGFVGFTPIQYEFIKAIESKCEKLVFSFDIPSTENVLGTYENHELFYPIKDTIKKLQDSFANIGKNVEIIKHKDTSRVERDKAFSHLSNYYLRENIEKYELKNSENPTNNPITIWNCLNPVKEAEFIAHEIIRLVKYEGYKFRDIAVVTGNLDDTYSVIKETFAKEGIPAYIDKKDSITGNPLCVFLLSLLEIIEKSFKGETILRFAKSSLANISQEDLDVLENYVIAHGINGQKKWCNDFTSNTYRNHENIDLDKINVSRKNLIDPVEKFKNAYGSSKTILEVVDAILMVFNECNIKEKLENYASESYESNDIVIGGAFNQIYDVVVGILNQLKKLIGEEKRPSAKELKEIIKSGIEDYAIGSLPPSIDEVQVGDIKRSRLGYVKALFLASFNEGIVPSPAASGGILNDSDRSVLESAGVVLAPSSRQTSFNEQYTIYQLISAPTKKLYFSYCRLSLSNETLNPSSYLEYIKEVFSNLREQNYVGYDASDISNSFEAISYVSKNLNKNNDKAVKDTLLSICNGIKSEEDLKFLNLVFKAAFFNYQGENLSRESIDKFYGSDINGSVSKLECHAKCSYQYFLKYVLKLKDRVGPEFVAFDRGNFYHSVLEKTFNSIIKLNKEYKDITSLEIDNIVSDAITDSKSEVKSFDILDTGKGAYFLEKWKKIVKVTIDNMIVVLEKTPFKPAYIEYEFDAKSSPSLDIVLNNGNHVKMSGKIDRVDTCGEDDVINFRIVDYKTYGATIDKNLIDAGIQLQLVTYMDAMEDVLKNHNPDKEINKKGIGYFPVIQKLIDANKPSDDITDKIAQAYKLITLDDELEELSDLVKTRSKEVAENIVSGDISKNPFLQGDVTSCKLCEFKDMCDFDPKLNGYSYRTVKFYDGSSKKKKGEKGTDDV